MTDLRVPYADQVVVLTENGELSDTKTPDELAQILGVSVGKSGIDSKKADGTVPVKEEKTESTVTLPKLPEVEIDRSRQRGDWGIYGLYAKAAGRFILIAFFLAMGVYAFCGSFPSKFFLTLVFLILAETCLYSYLARMVGRFNRSCQ